VGTDIVTRGAVTREAVTKEVGTKEAGTKEAETREEEQLSMLRVRSILLTNPPLLMKMTRISSATAGDTEMTGM
jgi:hypothetical protein